MVVSNLIVLVNNSNTCDLNCEKWVQLMPKLWLKQVLGSNTNKGHSAPKYLIHPLLSSNSTIIDKSWELVTIKKSAKSLTRSICKVCSYGVLCGHRLTHKFYLYLIRYLTCSIFSQCENKIFILIALNWKSPYEGPLDVNQAAGETGIYYSYNTEA